MLKNKIIVKKIRNILILFMSILIMIGAYHNVRRSRAENVIEISMEVADKNNSLEKQTVTIDATETKNGVYLAELPTSVNGNRVTKYYTSDGEELEIDPASVEKITLELTEDELANKKISLGTEYDKKTAIIDDVETTLYNKEFINEDGDVIVTGYMPLDVQLDFTEIDVNALKDIRLPSDDLTVKKSFGISIQEMIDVSKTTDKAETDDTTKTDGKNQVNDTTGLAENAQTNEIEKQLIEYDSTKYGEDITIKIKQADSKEETVIYSFSDGTPVTEVVYTNTDGILSFLKNDNDKFIYTVKKQETTDNVASEEQVGDDTQDSDEVQIDEDTTTSDDSTIVNKPNNGPKKAQARAGSKVATLDTIWSHGESLGNGLNNAQNSNFFGLVPRGKISSITLLRSDGKDSSGNKINFDVSGAQSQAIATGGSVTLYCVPNGSTYKAYMLPGSDVGTIKFNSDSRFIFSYLGYESSCTETEVVKGFFDSSSIVDTSGITQARAMFAHIGRNGSMRTLTIGPKFTTTSIKDTQDMFYECGFSNMTTLTFSSNFKMENATNLLSMFYRCGYNKLTSLDLSNMTTANATSMEHMFNMCGNQSLTSLKIGFNTSKVTSMHAMFANCGTEKLTTFSLGNNFNTSNVTDMGYMFEKFGGPLTELKLGSNFSTSKVTNMQGMFSQTGTKSMKKIQLGDKFTSIASGNYSDFLNNTGASGCKIYVPGAIYSNKHAVKLSTSSSTTISYTKGYIVGPDNAAPTWANNVNGAKYSATNHTYTMNLVGSDAVALDAEASKLTKGSTIKVKIGNSETSNYTLGATSLSSDENTKTFPLTINNYTGGAITITISAGTLIDLRENKSAAKTYNIASVDGTAPKWNSSVSGGTYSGSDKTYTLSLVGTDETSLDDSKSKLTKGSNITVKVNNTSTSNYTLGNTTLSSDGRTKTFPLTISSYSGGTIVITITKGALVDRNGNTEASGATYTIRPNVDTTAPKWSSNVTNGSYSSTGHTYSLTITGTDETQLQSNKLSTSNTTVQVNGSKVTNLDFAQPVLSYDKKTITIKLTIKNYTGGKITIKIASGALIDATGNADTKGATYEFTPNTDVTAPKWNSSVNNATYSSSANTYTFEVVGTDETSLKTGLTLNASNAPITVNGSTASVTYGSGQYSNSNKTVTFKITVRNYSGGKIVMNIKAGALQDNGNPVNSSVAQNYTMDPQTDFTAPVWNGSINNGKLSGSTYTLNLIGTDETKLQQTTLSTSNVSVTVGGKSASFSFSNRGQGQLSNNNKTITFGITISNFTGGNVTITINAGALKDAAGNSSVKKSYSFSVDATPPVWNGSINNGKLSGSTYTLNLIGTDETKLQQTTLSTSNVSVTVGGKSASFSFSNRGQGQLSNNNKTITFGITISNFTGGNVTITINAGALKDTEGNLSVKQTYSFSVDGTAPKWNSSVTGGTYSSTAHTYTVKLIGTDETKLNDSMSALSSSNVTIKINGTPISTFSFKSSISSDYKTKTFTLTITNYTGGKITIQIDEGALVDTAGNKEANGAKYEFTPNIDSVVPAWKTSISGGTYSSTNHTYSFSLVGTDETALNNSASVLNYDNMLVTVNGTKVTRSNLVFGSTSISSDNKTKTFPITINGFTGGAVVITINSGALSDMTGNKSSEISYKFTIDGTLPVWSNAISGGTYDENAKTYTFKLVGSDETGIQQTTLSSSNVTVTMGGKTANVTFSNGGKGTINDKTITFELTINSFVGGQINISISAGALKDTSNNLSAAKTYSFSKDVTPPTWNSKITSTSYRNSIYTVNVTGTDETALNNSSSTLSSSNVTVTVNGTAVSASNLTFSGQLASDSKSKAFAIGIKNFTGGEIKIVISKGALTDTSGNKEKTGATYSLTADITPPAWENATGKYNPDDQSYTITVTGTDDIELNTSASALTTSNSTLTVGGTAVTPTITKTASTSKSVTYEIKISKHTGGAISFKINEGALKDAQNNTSAEKTYTFTAVDAVKPTWASNISGGTYSNGTYTFNLVGTDNTKLNNSSSSLTSKLTIKTDSTVVSSSDLTIGNGTISSDGKTKTFPITVRNFKGGNVTISISSKALYDTTGNWSEAKTYTFFQDVTPPVWTDTIQNALYNHSTKAYKFDLVGTDETALSNSNSILNATITVGGSTASVTYGTTSFDSSTQAKTFPVTINSYTGGIIKITIAEGSLKDTANNKSIQKIYEFTPDITKPVWDYQNLAYDADSKTYSVELVGTDESALNTTVSSLITSGSSKNVTVTCGSTTVTPTLEKVITESKKIVYKLTINNYPGGAVTISIGANALIDASSNKSDAKEIKLPEKDITKPTLKVQNPSYSDTDGEYTFEVVATDEKAIDATRSSLSPSGSAQNITVKCGNVIVTPIVTIKSTTEKEIIYTVTIQKYPSGVVNVSIAEGAIYDTTGNKNAAATFTLPANDIAKPTWDDELQFNYDEGNQKITITLTGRDETSLNNSKSVLDFSNTIVTVGGSTLDEESNRVTFEEATLSADKMTKTFPITISGYTGGKIQIAIDSGALEDNSGKKSDAKEYEIIDIIKPEWKMEGAGTYNKTAKSYTLKFKGTDEAELASASLTASDLTVTVNGTAVTPTIAAIDSESDIKTKVFTVTIANFTGGEIKTIIKQGTLTDRGNNKNNEATFSVTPDITIPVWTYRSAAYTQYQGNEVSIEFTGTDNVQLVSSKLKLDTEGFIVKEGSTVIDSSRLTLNKEEYGDGKGGIKYVLKMTGYSNGSITITLPEGLLTDASGNTSNATTLTVGVIPPLDDDTPPAVSNIVEKQDKGMEAVVIDFDITDEWFDFKEAVESGEITITKTTKSYFGQGTTSDITSSCNIKITKETKLSNGKHYQVKISNIDTSTSGKYGGSNTFTITLKANSVHDLAGNGNVSTQLFNGTINFTLSSSDPAFLKYSVELDESNKTLDVVIIANTANSFFDHFKQSGQWGWRNNI